VKAVILAGGLGSRISEETYLRPKPMVSVGEKPILWHVMKKFAMHGVTDFVICLGYKGDVIRQYFLNFKSYNSSMTVATASSEVVYFDELTENWNVTLVDTGASANTGERLKQVRKYLGKDKFFFTYGDGLTDQDLDATVSFHSSSGKMVTLTAVNPPARYGAVQVESGIVKSFMEKASSEGSLINGGYFVVNPEIFDILSKFENPSWEFDILPELAAKGSLAAFEHYGFWYAMDTLRDKEHLESLWESGSAPWSI
jgi:glucose-1-phosphate cytidylyltransferase